MPNHKSFKKSLKQEAKRRAKNRQVKSIVKTSRKKVMNAETVEEAKAQLPEAYSILDKAWKRGVLPKNRVRRYKGRLARFVNAMATK